MATLRDLGITTPEKFRKILDKIPLGSVSAQIDKMCRAYWWQIEHPDTSPAMRLKSLANLQSLLRFKLEVDGVGNDAQQTQTPITPLSPEELAQRLAQAYGRPEGTPK